MITCLCCRDWYEIDHSVNTAYFRWAPLHLPAAAAAPVFTPALLCAPLVDSAARTARRRLVADKKHTFPGPYENAGRGAAFCRGAAAAGTVCLRPAQCAVPHAGSWRPAVCAGSSVAWARDQDVALDFPTLAKALTQVARGEVSLWPCHLAEVQRPGHCTIVGVWWTQCRICRSDAPHPLVCSCRSWSAQRGTLSSARSSWWTKTCEFSTFGRLTGTPHAPA